MQLQLFIHLTTETIAAVHIISQTDHEALNTDHVLKLGHR